MENLPHNWNKEDSIRSVKDILSIGKTALAGLISWAGQIPERVDTYYANKINGENDD